MEACLGVFSNFGIQTSNFLPRSRAAWQSDWLPCHPSLTNGGIRDRRFKFCTLLTDQRPSVRLAAGNVRTCAMHAAAMAMDPELEAIRSPPVQCSFSAKARSANRATSKHRAVRTIKVTRRVLISPERHASTSIDVADRRSETQSRWLAPSDHKTTATIRPVTPKDQFSRS